MVGVMAQKKRAAVRKLIRVDEEILRLAAAELVRRVAREVTQSLAAGTIKLSGFGARDRSRRPTSLLRSAGCRRRHGSGQHG
jgi:hypothetical protein